MTTEAMTVDCHLNGIECRVGTKTNELAMCKLGRMTHKLNKVLVLVYHCVNLVQSLTT